MRLQRGIGGQRGHSLGQQRTGLVANVFAQLAHQGTGGSLNLFHAPGQLAKAELVAVQARSAGQRVQRREGGAQVLQHLGQRKAVFAQQLLQVLAHLDRQP